LGKTVKITLRGKRKERTYVGKVRWSGCPKWLLFLLGLRGLRDDFVEERGREVLPEIIASEFHFFQKEVGHCIAST
jgi:hypothetical protein